MMTTAVTERMNTITTATTPPMILEVSELVCTLYSPSTVTPTAAVKEIKIHHDLVFQKV